MIGHGAVALDHLRGRQPGPRRDIGEIKAERRIVTGRQAPQAAALLGHLQALHQLGDARRQRCRREDQRIVMHQERPEGRHRLDESIESRLIQPPRERQDPGAEPPIDGFAELDDDGRVAGIQPPIIRHQLTATI